MRTLAAGMHRVETFLPFGVPHSHMLGSFQAPKTTVGSLAACEEGVQDFRVSFNFAALQTYSLTTLFAMASSSCFRKSAAEASGQANAAMNLFDLIAIVPPISKLVRVFFNRRNCSNDVLPFLVHRHDTRRFARGGSRLGNMPLRFVAKTSCCL